MLGWTLTVEVWRCPSDLPSTIDQEIRLCRINLNEFLDACEIEAFVIAIMNREWFVFGDGIETAHLGELVFLRSLNGVR